MPLSGLDCLAISQWSRCACVPCVQNWRLLKNWCVNTRNTRIASKRYRKNFIMAIKDQTHVTSSVDEEVTPSDRAPQIRRIIFLVIGDTIVFLVFAIVGILNHGKPLTPLNLAQDTIPFMLGWFLVAPYIGAFSRKKTATPGKMAFYTILAWLPS